MANSNLPSDGELILPNIIFATDITVPEGFRKHYYH